MEQLMRAPTLWQLLEQRVRATPEATMLIDGASGETISFSGFLDRAEHLASGLYALGIGPGQVVAWQLPTRVQSITLMLALARLGVVQNPILHLYRQRELAALLEQSQPELLIVPGRETACDYPAMAAEARPGQKILDLSRGLPDADPAALPPVPRRGDEIRWLYCTSGTTAGPKAARHTDTSVMAGGYTLAESLEMTPKDVGSIAYPIAHIGGVMYTTMVLATGMSAVLIEKFVPSEAVTISRHHGVTQAGGSTAHYQALLNEQRKQPGEPVIPGLKVLSGGGASKPPELVRDIKREMHCDVLHAYGMTEAPLIAHCRREDSDEQKMVTDGRPVTGMEVRIRRLDGGVAGPGEEGEIIIRGTSLCQGYLDAGQTRAAFTDDGFYHTGDLGLLRDDGCLVITGRIKDIIIRKGENISAREIEDLLFSHPRVAAVAVIGLPDKNTGERVCAVVEAVPDLPPLTFSEMVDYLNDQGLMRQKVPERLEVVDELPRNQALNKVLKYELRKRFSES